MVKSPRLIQVVYVQCSFFDLFDSHIHFRNVLREGVDFASQIVASCFDLNPVRTGLCQDPEDYRYCGYGEAIASRCKKAIRAV